MNRKDKGKINTSDTDFHGPRLIRELAETVHSYAHRTVCHAAGEFARDDDGDGFCEVHVNTLEGFWSLLRSWLRPHRGVSQEKLPLYLGFFEFVHNVAEAGQGAPRVTGRTAPQAVPRNTG